MRSPESSIQVIARYWPRRRVGSSAAGTTAPCKGAIYSKLPSEETIAPLSFANLVVYVRETTLTAGRTRSKTLAFEENEPHVQACMYISMHRVKHV